MKSTAGFAAIRAQPLGRQMQKRHPARMAFGPAAFATEPQRAPSADAISAGWPGPRPADRWPGGSDGQPRWHRHHRQTPGPRQRYASGHRRPGHRADARADDREPGAGRGANRPASWPEAITPSMPAPARPARVRPPPPRFTVDAHLRQVRRPSRSARSPPAGACHCCWRRRRLPSSPGASRGWWRS